MRTLGDAVNLFTCCIFTWKAVVIVLPAFLAAGAVITFVPDTSVMRYFGARANKFVSYGMSSVSGLVLNVCSCNVVPIFAGILRRGAGIGPAFTFVYAAPAIHIVNAVFVLQVIGPKMALWRFLAVPVIAVMVGLMMRFLFRGEDEARHREMQAATAAVDLTSIAGSGRGAAVLVAMLLSILVFGAWDGIGEFLGKRVADVLLPAAAASVNWKLVGVWIRVIGASALILGAVWYSLRRFGREETTEWGRQTYLLLRMVLPVFIPAVIAIALLVNHIPISWLAPTKENPPLGGLVLSYPQGDRLLPTFLAAVFGALMYFPILTEVAFVKGLLLQQVAVAPALAILLTGPGLSLPGLILVRRVAGLKKMAIYFALMIVLATAVSYLFGHLYGRYLCACQAQAPGVLGK
jgi:hypothetical protein